MRRMLLRFGTPVADTQFKRASQGWIFRARSPWVVCPRPHYLVNDTEKCEIEPPERRRPKTGAGKGAQ